MTVEKKGKRLASVPASLRKDEAVQELKARAADLRKQASRMRESLEAAMCRGDAFIGRELPGLFAHPVLAPMLSRLVFAGEGVMGYPAEGGRLLRDAEGKLEPVKPAERLRIAHPDELFRSGGWDRWQRECFAAERVQPFKQVFRELYPLTAAERGGATHARRYAGQQVNPSRALALLGKRGWVSSPEQGVQRTFHAEGITAWVTFEEGFFTPAEIDGLTLEGVMFAKRGEYKPLRLEEVPARLFSEVMRDMDLVVSVAHRGGVDPEASGSTVEMRGALLRETAQLLGMGNVRIRGSHALIDGTMASYSVHLGSAVAYVQPGGMLFLVPVHSQHRGRLFLPFADDDPRTAEVLSKVIMLARDDQIRDPSVLSQIRGIAGSGEAAGSAAG